MCATRSCCREQSTNCGCVEAAIYLYMHKYGKVRKRKMKGLPREGYRTICVTDKVYIFIKKKAAETNRTIPEYIKTLIEEERRKAKTKTN